MPQHSHSYSGASSYNDGHIHHYGGVTSKATTGVPHSHNMEGITTMNDGHVHKYSTKTGPAMNLPNGRHYHYYQTKVQYADGHIHYIRGCTSAD